ncbi:hypothetical protein BpHYR1_041167 [Brachionus plicatilis]|uniref:Uncharacterized protein n=1 Tax=Brachionus plicatilis TaxID=10195 RepID=A0A3M7P3K7_BRAPC|nr:hypothetical protein BpHYR1_041167 [Brachionus plicatilis]
MSQFVPLEPSALKDGFIRAPDPGVIMKVPEVPVVKSILGCQAFAEDEACFRCQLKFPLRSLVHPQISLSKSQSKLAESLKNLTMNNRVFILVMIKLVFIANVDQSKCIDTALNFESTIIIKL